MDDAFLGERRMKTQETSVSVVIPCYNGARFLKETLASVLAQSHRPLEVLVVDDGSTDGSAEIAEAFPDPVRVLRQSNRGESVARNRGMNEATGEWIAFLDADDVWKPEKLKRQLAVAGPDVVGIHSDLYYFGSRNGVSDIRKRYGDERYSLERLAISNTLAGPGSTLMVRRELAPRFPEWTRYAEDQIFCLELVRRGRVVLVEEPLTGYRIHSNSQSQQNTYLVTIRWHESIATWLSQQTDVTDEFRRGVHAGWAVKLAEALNGCYRARDWAAYHEIAEYLKDYSDHPEIQEALSRKIYPRWTYAGLALLRAGARRARRMTPVSRNASRLFGPR
ncbi:MAG: glycosyltransferase [Candidatus Paceibacterota bacterium]